MKILFTITLSLFMGLALWAKPELPVKPAAQKASDMRFVSRIKQNHYGGIEKIKEYRNSYRLLGQFQHYWTGESYDSAARLDFVYANTYTTDVFQMINSMYSGEGFTPVSRETYFKDEAGRDTLVLTEYTDFASGIWMDYYRFKMRYDTYGNQLLYMYEFWDEFTSSWIAGWGNRFTYEYDDNGNMLSMAAADYFGEDIWIPWLKMLYEYNSNNENISTIEQNWNEIDEKWVNSFREDYELENGAWSQVIYSYWSEGSEEWVLQGRAIDISWLDFESFKWLTVTLQEHDGADWLNSERGTALYNQATNPLNIAWEAWDTNLWVPNYRESYMYDEFQNVLQQKTEFWTGFEWMTAFGERYGYTFDAYGNMTSITLDNWDWETNDWLKVLKIDQWFEVLTSIAQKPATSLMAYPNPATDMLSIEFTLPSLAIIPELLVVDMAGRVVLRPILTADQSIQHIDISQLKPGAYILYLKNSQEAISTKIIKK